MGVGAHTQTRRHTHPNIINIKIGVYTPTYKHICTCVLHVYAHSSYAYVHAHVCIYIHLCSTDTSIMEPCCVRNVSDTRIGHTCRVYF